MKNIRRYDAFIVLLIYMIWIAVFSAFYPIGGDDFSAVRVASRGWLGQFIYDYTHWSVRTGCALSYFPLIYGKWLFNIFNPVIQAGLVVLAWLAAFGKLPKADDAAERNGFILLTLFFWFGLARTRDTAIWMCGATNYSWSMLFVLGFLALMRRTLARNENHAAMLSLLGLAAGFANENIAAVGVFAIGVGIIYCRKKQLKPANSVIAGAAAFVLGVAAMFAAPGVWVRAKSADSGLQAAGIVGRLRITPDILAFWAAAMPLVLLILVWSCFKLKRKIPVPSMVFAAGSLLLALVFAGAGVLPAMRAYYSSTVLMAMAATVAAVAAFRPTALKLPLGAVAIAGVLILAPAVKDLAAIHADDALRKSELAAARAKGERNPVFTAHRTCRQNFLQYVWVEDITADPEFFDNVPNLVTGLVV